MHFELLPKVKSAFQDSMISPDHLPDERTVTTNEELNGIVARILLEDKKRSSEPFSTSIDAAIGLVLELRPNDISDIQYTAHRMIGNMHSLHVRFWNEGSELDGNYTTEYAKAIIVSLVSLITKDLNAKG